MPSHCSASVDEVMVMSKVVPILPPGGCKAVSVVVGSCAWATRPEAQTIIAAEKA